MNEKERRSFPVFGEGDSPVAPIEATIFTADEIGELVDALSRKSIVRCCRSEDGGARQQN